MALGAAAKALLDEERGHAILAAVFGNSPFLTRCLLSDVAFSLDVVTKPPDSTLAAALDALGQATAGASDTAALNRALRIARQRVALVTAVADLTAAWPLEAVTAALSGFADRAVGLAATHHLRAAAANGALTLDADDPLGRSGLFFLGLGKLGANELNYSSDIDFAVFYDPERVPAPDPDRVRQILVRLTQAVVASLQDHTADGYVFRTDLRLRPDPNSTPLAISTLAAETYYESMGQNWERAAMIKARVIAGDADAGADFLAMLRPFVWRRNLDFAAIQDVHSIKRQINAHHGGAAIAVAGHNLKLGRGGIREVEFFAQTQQLIFGGRDPELRRPATCDALRALAAAGRIDDTTADTLIGAYRFLRTVEHRLQMIDDRQTHSLPEDPAALEAFARFAGYPDTEAFSAALLGHLHAVEDHYADLFEEAPSLSGAGNLVFTGGEHDPDTLGTLAKLGYTDPETVSTLIRGWHHGRYAATRSRRAREILTELVPTLVEELARTANPDVAFRRFDEFLQGLPAGVQLFSLFHANPELLRLVAEIMGTAPRLAAHLSRQPALFDAVIAGEFFDPLPERAALAEDLAIVTGRARDFEDTLDIVRRWTADRRFCIDAQFLRGTIDAEAAGAAHSDVADVAVATLLPATQAEFARRHGQIPGGAFCILALGKLGGRELSATSDLDLVFVYRAPEDAEESDGARPLAVSHFYARFAQRYLNALTAPTSAGPLFDVDMRLRPAGAQGPLASSLAAFRDYLADKAWTWEQMAMTRARFVAGDPDLGDAVMAAVHDRLTAPRDPDALLRAVAKMRHRIADTHRAPSLWQVKHVRGGLVDVEFIAQYLELRHAAEHPDVLSANTADAFTRLRDAGLLDPAVADRLADAARLWQRIQAMLRLSVADRFTPETATEGLRAALARAAGADDFDTLLARMETVAAAVTAAYDALIEDPAQALPPEDAAGAGTDSEPETIVEDDDER